MKVEKQKFDAALKKLLRAKPLKRADISRKPQKPKSSR
jgi:hypothetical protein